MAGIIGKATAQTDYSGNYSFSFDVAEALEPPKDQKNAGPEGFLTLFKIDSVQYKFWLNVNKGYPSFNMGMADGFITVKSNKAVYETKTDYADSSCKIIFTFHKNFVELEQRSTDFDCGFGHNVYADGKYEKKDALKLNNAGIKKQYIEISVYKIVADRAFLFEDKEGVKIKKQYFIKNDRVFSPAEDVNFVYVEFITANGKFIYGWLNKKDIKPSE
jgi:hypothetical protein